MVDGAGKVMYVTEEILYQQEKFMSQENEDGVFTHYENVRLTCAIEDSSMEECWQRRHLLLANPNEGSLPFISSPKFQRTESQI